MQILNGTILANKIYENLPKVSANLCIIQVGNNDASAVYVAQKKKRLEFLGFNYIHHKIEPHQLEECIKSSANDSSINGIIVQLPIPSNLYPLLEHIPWFKDVDGITARNRGMVGEDGAFTPCTALGCIHMLTEYNIPIKGSRVAIFGKSALVGRPISILLQNMGATVVSINKFDENPGQLSAQCEILISAIGLKHYIKPELVKKNSVLIDIGITKTDAVYGDIHQDSYQKAQYFSRPIGGVGPLTVAFLMQNLVKSVLTSKKYDKIA